MTSFDHQSAETWPLQRRGGKDSETNNSSDMLQLSALDQESLASGQAVDVPAVDQQALSGNTSEPFQVNSAAVLTENEIIVDNLEVYPVNDSLECARRNPFEHGPVCHLCHTHRLDRDDPDLHLKACLAKHDEQSLTIECNICIENIKAINKPFGIQENCNHSFCYSCIKRWQERDEMVNNRACPVCRTPSGYILNFPLWITCPRSKKNLFDCKKRRFLRQLIQGFSKD